ncbi:ATP-binding protein [Saccharothrix variisporea]|uniref:Tetratricopeptide (TPR) repeat protein n=1 Tax=Saccharothrix variisporea TaxID=543527 RepID=A0A495X4F1_9PSEU|nr:tetratricopeptide repeat protein [Saccharothrix variisporea]RKT68426.1 tetratricopeptide (TPR) repeat protein [Saccharothrix variisporea]
MDGDLSNSLTGSPSGPVVQAGTITGNIHFHPPTPPAPINQLPPDVPHFVGRAAELALLTAHLDRGTALPIAAISGTGGMGKTTLAVHWAHRELHRFPDGVLYANLRGFGPGDAVPPATVVRDFLDAFRVPAERVPAGVDAQAALYRSLIRDRRMLVLLDNARAADQVRPLLPGSPTSAVLITSRYRLDSLIAREQADHLPLDRLSAQESRTLLTARLTDPRVTDDEAVDRLVARCGRLPLALAIAGARAVTEPHRPLDHLVPDLDDLSTGDSPDTDLRAVFDSSYRALAPGEARLFRLLGLHPGGDIAHPAAASLAGLPLAATRTLLTALTRASLLTALPGDRFQVHDLLHEYAAERAAEDEAAADRRSAIVRLLDHYTHTSYAGERRIYPSRDAIALPGPAPGVVLPDVPDRGAAWEWFGAERANLMAVLFLAAREGFDRHAIVLPWALSSYLGRVGQWRDWELSQLAALSIARATGDRAAEALGLLVLGRIRTLAGQRQEAVRWLEEALEVTTDPAGAAHVHEALSLVHERDGELEMARSYAEDALDLARRAGHRIREARALAQLGRVWSELGDHRAAHHCCARVAEVLAGSDDQSGLADAAEGMARALLRLGEPARARAHCERAIALYREVGDRWWESVSWHRLGDIHAALGEVDAARSAWQRAAEVFDDLGHPDAAVVRAKLENA